MLFIMDSNMAYVYMVNMLNKWQLICSTGSRLIPPAKETSPKVNWGSVSKCSFAAFSVGGFTLLPAFWSIIGNWDLFIFPEGTFEDCKVGEDRKDPRTERKLQADMQIPARLKYLDSDTYSDRYQRTFWWNTMYLPASRTSHPCFSWWKCSAR